MVAKESQNETRRLASAIDTLNSDRDRLYSRVTVLEQGLDSVTGAITRQNSAAASAQPAPASSPTAETQPVPQSPGPAPAASPVATTVAAIPEKPRTALPEQAAAAASSAGTGNFKCASSDAGNAAHGVEIDHGPTGFRGRKTDRARPGHAAQAGS